MRWRVLFFVALGALGRCGDDQPTIPPPPVPRMDAWYFYPVICFGCPGLTNVEIDRTATPPRVTLPVGKLTSLRAKPFSTCVPQGPDVNVVRWTASDPSVIRFEPSGSGSTIVIALSPGISRITAERLLPDGTISVASLSDPNRADTACVTEPEFLFEVVR